MDRVINLRSLQQAMTEHVRYARCMAISDTSLLRRTRSFLRPSVLFHHVFFVAWVFYIY